VRDRAQRRKRSRSEALIRAPIWEKEKRGRESLRQSRAAFVLLRISRRISFYNRCVDQYRADLAAGWPFAKLEPRQRERERESEREIPRAQPAPIAIIIDDASSAEYCALSTPTLFRDGIRDRPPWNWIGRDVAIDDSGGFQSRHDLPDVRPGSVDARRP